MKKKLLFILLLFCLLVGLGLYYLLNLQQGLHLLTKVAGKLSGRSFSVDQVEGRLLSAWSLKDLKITTPAADISCGLLSFDWRADGLFKGSLHIAGISLKDVVVAVKSVDAETAAPFSLPETLLPIPLLIERLDVAGLKILHPDGSLLTDIHRLGLRFNGDRRRLEIQDGLLDADRYGLQLHGFLEIDGKWSTDLMGSWRINPPEYAEMGGTFSARGPLDQLQVTAAGDRPADVRVSGILYGLPHNPHWQARAEGRQVWFPAFYPTWPKLRLSAVVDAAGDFSGYHGTVKTQGTSFLDFHDITGTSDVIGDHAGLTARSLHLSSAGGAVQIGDLALAWLHGFKWRGEVQTEDFNPAGFDARLMGSITADLTSEGYVGYGKDGHLQTSTDIRFLEGTVRDFPVTGKGKISSLASRLQVQDLFLQSGASSLRATGVIDDTYDLQFDLASPDIGEVLPGAKGEINARGRVAGSREFPLLDLDLDAAGVRYGGEIIERLTAKVHADTRPGAEMKATVEGEKISFASVVLRSGKIELTGSAEDHNLKARLQTDQGDLQLAIQGALQDKLWQGRVHDLQMRLPSAGSWLQQQTAALAITKEGFTLADLCLGQEKGRICLAGDWRRNEGKSLWRAEGKVQDLSLTSLNDNDLLAWPVRGSVDATLAVTGDSERIISGDVEVAVPQTHIELGLAEEGFAQLSLQETTLHMHLADQKLQTTVKSGFQDKSSVALQMAIDQAGIFAQPFWLQPLKGELQIDMQDLSPFAALTDFFLRPTGRLNSALAITGTLSHPVFSGQLDLRDGKIALPSLGIFLQDVGVSLAAMGETVEIQGSARSGPGSVTAEGTIAYSGAAGIQGDFRILGEQFEAVRLPEYEIQVNPDIRFRFNGEKGELTGDIFVPKALLTPEEMKDSVNVSGDVIYTDQEQEEKISRWPLDSDLRVKLGDDVQIDGYGLKGRLLGSLAVRDTSDTFMSGRGELTLKDGIFSIYGRSMAVDRGRILFSGGPVDNPVIDARALQSIKEKRVAGNDLIIGVDVSGNLQDLEYKLFSDPSMDESDILAYMVVGHSRSASNKDEGSILEAAASVFGLEEGAGMVNTLADLLPVDEMHLEGTKKEGTMSLVVGKKLTDNLFIGYDHNFFDQKGEFRLSYDLGYGFSAVTRSSANSNGADIFYSIDK